MAKPTPEAQRVLDLFSAANAGADRPVSPVDVVRAWREQLEGVAALNGVVPDLEDIADTSFEHGATSIVLRCFRPAGAQLPAMVYFHGGGFVAGSLNSYDTVLRTLAKETGWGIVGVEYRLAPEHPYPAGLHDCYAALRHVAANADRFGLDADRIVVAGDSAGGLLAVATSLMARDKGGPALAGVLCFYPNADLRENGGYPSLDANDGLLLHMNEFWQVASTYLPGIDRSLPYVSPVLTRDLGRLPPSLIITCECDPFLDEGELLANRLREAGAKVESVCLEGMVHGLLSFMPLVPEAAQILLRSVRSFLVDL